MTIAFEHFFIQFQKAKTCLLTKVNFQTKRQNLIVNFHLSTIDLTLWTSVERTNEKKKIGNWSQKGPRDSENGEDTCNATKKRRVI